MIKLDHNFLRGSYTPVVTPFREGSVNYEKFAELVDRQAREGSHGVVVAGGNGGSSRPPFVGRSLIGKTGAGSICISVPLLVAGTEHAPPGPALRAASRYTAALDASR